jgi:hypothetical protein
MHPADIGFEPYLALIYNAFKSYNTHYATSFHVPPGLPSVRLKTFPGIPRQGDKPP